MTIDHIAGNPGKIKAPSPWNDDRVTRLKALWGKGLSASKIAIELRVGTRMAVIGKARRLGLTFRAPQRTIARLPPRPVKAKFKRSAQLRRPPRIRDMAPTTNYSLVRDPNLDQVRITFAELEPHHCRWPIGEPTEGFCGHSKVTGQPYCKGHCDRAFGVVQADPPPSVQHVINGDVAMAAAVDEFLEVAA